jgi:hypothetical protein
MSVAGRSGTGTLPNGSWPYCQVSQDGDDEGILQLNRLPTPQETEVIRAYVGIHQTRQVGADHGYWLRKNTDKTGTTGAFSGITGPAGQVEAPRLENRILGQPVRGRRSETWRRNAVLEWQKNSCLHNSSRDPPEPCKMTCGGTGAVEGAVGSASRREYDRCRGCKAYTVQRCYRLRVKGVH